METLMTQKVLTTNTDISDKYFVKSKKVKDLIYTSGQKCKSLEYIFDTLIKDISLVIHELDEKVYIITTNSIVSSFEFIKVENEFEIKKIKDFINILLFKKAINKIYFLQNSILKEQLNFNDDIKIEEIKISDYKKAYKNNPILKTQKNYLISTLSITILLLISFFIFKNIGTLLQKEKIKEFNSSYTTLEKNLNIKKEEKIEYEILKNKSLDILYDFKQLENTKEIK
ncbi:hypothetical protein N5912_02550 [Arcobacter lacus]|uniref:hypothetical protein n=1 Tax=Arcobacter lacus TaxID=1912876 RepID=UPI0021BA9C56|nr:hypothetical protein [Arcobacter lacus]MCT7910699.1 hypothetical protein [Arcobacter lacus]